MFILEYTYIYIYIIIYIMDIYIYIIVYGSPEICVPPNRPCYFRMFRYIQLLGYPHDYGKPHADPGCPDVGHRLVLSYRVNGLL